MSRVKKGAASESKVPAQQEETALNPLLFSIAQLREMFKEIQYETIKEFKEETKKISDRL